MRLTKKVYNYYDSASDEWHQIKDKKIDLNYVFNLEQKLGQLEDIEEELGIDLVTLIKASKDGIWYNSNGTLYFSIMDISFSEKCFREYIDYYKSYNEFYFKDYGKTWALTKEELL